MEGKVAIITGSSSGIGRAIALAYAREGAKVVCSARRRVPTEKEPDPDKRPTDEIITSNGGDAIFIPCDVTDETQVKKLVKGAVDKYGQIDVLVCNAGVWLGDGPLHLASMEYLDKCLDVNLKGMWYCCQQVLATMLHDNNGGSIICIGSSASLNPYPVQACYCVSKAACAMLTKCIALEYGCLGIRSNAICPTNVNTAINADTTQTKRERFSSRIPLGRYGEPNEVADIAVFLGSGESAFVNGALIAADGGETIGNLQMGDFGLSAESLKTGIWSLG